MKKVVCVLVFMICTLCLLCACAKYPTEIKDYKEFSLCSNGKEISPYSDFLKIPDYMPQNVVMYSLLNNGSSDYPDTRLESFRKIKIGNSLNDVADAYKGISAVITDEQETVVENIDVFFGNRADYNISESKYYLTISTFFKDGKALSDNSEERTNGESLSIRFIFDGNNISDIMYIYGIVDENGSYERQ